VCVSFREKKREKERDELWKRLSELEVNNRLQLQSQQQQQQQQQQPPQQQAVLSVQK